MGSGISLSKAQVKQIIKRDLLLNYSIQYCQRKPAYTASEIYENCLIDAKFSVINKAIDKIF